MSFLQQVRYLNGGHGDGHVKRLAVFGILHYSQAVGALHVLRGVLSGCQEYSGHDVRRVRIEASDGSS